MLIQLDPEEGNAGRGLRSALAWKIDVVVADAALYGDVTARDDVLFFFCFALLISLCSRFFLGWKKSGACQ